MKSKLSKSVIYILSFALVFVLGGLAGIVSLGGFDDLSSSILDLGGKDLDKDLGDLKADLSRIEDDSFFVGAKKYPENFPSLPYLDQLNLQSVSKSVKDDTESYLLHLDVGYGTPLSHVENLKRAYEADSWDVQVPEPLNNVYTFHAEKDNLVVNMALETSGTVGADFIVVSVKALAE